MKLKPNEAEKLREIYNLVSKAFNLLEDLRPGGGFKDYIEDEYCKECRKTK